MTTIEKTGAFWWDDLALSLSNPPQTAEISWGGYTANMRLDNYQGTLGALSGGASAGATKDSGTVNIAGGSTFCVSPDNMFVDLNAELAALRQLVLNSKDDLARYRAAR